MLSPIVIVTRLNCNGHRRANRQTDRRHRVQTSPPIHSVKRKKIYEYSMSIEIFAVISQRQRLRARVRAKGYGKWQRQHENYILMKLSKLCSKFNNRKSFVFEASTVGLIRYEGIVGMGPCHVAGMRYDGMTG